MTTLPFATEFADTVVYGCKDVCMSPCVYAARSNTVHSGLSPRDKTRTDITTHNVTWGPIILPNFPILSLKTFPLHQMLLRLTLRVST